MPSAPRTARALARAELTRAILDRASVQLAEVGPAALSVRQIARDLEMASSAVYRYFPSRDALLTALLIRAFDDMGARGRGRRRPARARRPARPVHRRSRTRCAAGRAPTRTSTRSPTGPPSPGTPRRGHRRLGHPGGRRVLLALVRDAQADGRPLGARTREVSPAERAADRRRSAASSSPPLDDAHAVRGLMAWATLFGHVSLELFGHMYNAACSTTTSTSRRSSGSWRTTWGSRAGPSSRGWPGRRCRRPRPACTCSRVPRASRHLDLDRRLVELAAAGVGRRCSTIRHHQRPSASRPSLGLLHRGRPGRCRRRRSPPPPVAAPRRPPGSTRFPSRTEVLTAYASTPSRGVIGSGW